MQRQVFAYTMSPELHFTWSGGRQLRTCIMLADTNGGSSTSFSHRVCSHHTWSAAARQFHRVMFYVMHAYPCVYVHVRFRWLFPYVCTYTAVHIQYPCVCVYNVKHLSVCGRVRCIVPVNMSNNWLKRFCIQGMWGTNSVFERLIILKWPKLHLCLEIIYFWNCNTTCQGQNIEWKLFSWQLYKHREHQKTTQY